MARRLFLIFLLFFTSTLRAQTAFESDLRALAQSSSRFIGSPGYTAAGDYLRTQTQSLPNVELREQSFPILVPVTDSATLTVVGASIDIHPLWPAGVRLNSTPRDGITGTLVYAGNCTLPEIPAKTIRNQIAVIEASAAERWTQTAYFGAAAIVILGDDRTTNNDLRSHDFPVPINCPRFYVTPKDAEKIRALAKSSSASAILHASVNWQPRVARNFYALVTGPQAQTPAITIAASYDSSSLVPDLSPGAGQAVQAAAALSLLRDLSAHPPNRPILIAFTGGDTIQFTATRQMLMALGQSPLTLHKEITILMRANEESTVDLSRIAPLTADPRLIDLRNDAHLIELLTKTIESDIVRGRTTLFDLRSRATDSADQQEVDRLVQEQITLGQLKYALQSNPAAITPELMPPAQKYLTTVAAQLQRQGLADSERLRQLRERSDLYTWLATRIHRNPAPAEFDNSSRLIELLIALDLSSTGHRAGPMYVGSYQQSSALPDLLDYKDWFAKQTTAKAAWLQSNRAAFDLSPLLESSRSPQTWLAGSLPLGSEMAQAWGIPAFSLITLDDAREYRDTPNDTLAHIDIPRITPQLSAVRDLLFAAGNDANFKGPTEKRPVRMAFTGQVVSPAPDRPVPDLPREGFLTTFYYLQNPTSRIPGLATLPYSPGVRRLAVTDTDALGRYRFEGLPRLGADPQMRKLAVEAYKIEPNTGAITAATNLGRQSGDLSCVVDLNADILPVRSVVFDCTEFSLFGLYDPRFLQTLTELLPLDARRNTSLDDYNFLASNGILSGLVEPATRMQLLFRFGSVGNRLMLLNVADPASKSIPRNALDAAQGFKVDTLQSHEGAILPLALQTAQDFWRLDDLRLRAYAAAGISSTQLTAMHASAAGEIRDALAAYNRNDAATMMDRASSAWSTETRVYRAADDLGSDVVHAAIFLLLLCVPFSFAMERLLIASPNIYKQLAGSSTIFILMTLALAAFHPAFKISSSPLVIVLAFAVLFMSALVIILLYGKFDAELKRIRSGRAIASSMGTPGAAVFMSAVLLGIASMRRRKFRTLLTSITIVLITFAVLCFTSSTRYLDTTRTAVAPSAPHTGILLRQRGFRPMPPAVAENIRTALSTRSIAAPLIEQWWNVNAVDPNEQLNLAVASGKDSRHIAPVAAVLGLSPGASTLHNLNLPALDETNPNIIYLPKPIAISLHANIGDTISLAGHFLTLAGIFDPDDFDRRALSLADEPLRPLSYHFGELDAGGRALTDDPTAETLSPDSAESAGSYEHLPSSGIAIVPAAIAKILPNATLRTLSVQLDDSQIKPISDDLSKRFSLAIFAGDSHGVSLVTASNLQSVSGAGQVAVPLAIAGLIIFNTMMGSIAERKREIHVYTSLGLAPIHVGALFVAEALTYGLIGAVFGYVVGQGAGTLLSHLGLLGSVTLNYSGTSAMLTMSLILLIVFLSALVPARLASKIAAPSIERNWKVPAPTGDEIIANLPFTISKAAADGALAYLADFFDANREGSIGKFSAAHVDPFSFENETGQLHRGLKTTVWLTPFDLGVRQHLMLLIHPGEFPDIYEVQVVLHRLSGDDGSWYRLNRTFLTLLRQQFLQWRSLSPQRMQHYIDASHTLFEPHAATPA